jgi:two-component system, OmpR family, response regulator
MLKLKVLFVDDEMDFCLLMKNFFTKKNYDVFLAYTLKDGLEQIGSVKPDILFLDNNLPDGKGWDHVEEIVEKNPQTRVYLASAHYKGEAIFENFPQVTVWEKPLSMTLLQENF